MADITVPSKPFWQSTTLWVNAIIGLATLVAELAQPDQPWLGLLGPKQIQYLAMAGVIANWVLRCRTGLPITGTLIHEDLVEKAQQSTGN